ncbi:hypothetical protein U1Q18_023373 [Sarracenia purpurea var. burkii]
MDISNQLKERVEDLSSDGRLGIESQSIAGKVEKGAFIRSREGTSPLPSALDPLSGSKRGADDEDEAQKDEDSIETQVPTEAPEGSTLNLENRKVSDYGSGQDENENEQAEANEGWTQVGKDKGKALMQNSSFSGKSDEPVPYIAASPIFEPVCSMGKEVASGILEKGAQLVDHSPVTEVPLPETSSLEKVFWLVFGYVLVALVPLGLVLLQLMGGFAIRLLSDFGLLGFVHIQFGPLIAAGLLGVWLAECSSNFGGFGPWTG